MSARSLLFVGVALVAVGAGWAGVRAHHATVSPPAGDVVAAALAAPAGDAMTLRFYRSPSAAPDFSARDLDGRTISPSAYRGKVVLLNFWATWCPPCRAEIPDLIELQQKYHDRLQVIGISEDDAPPDVVRQFVAQHHINYPVIMSTPDVERLYPGISALPTSYEIDRQGLVEVKHVGELTPQTTELELRSLAGLPVNATIERVDAIQKAELGPNALATEIPGIDLKALPAERRADALQKLNSEGCTCGCDLSLAKCRIDDPTCGVSLPLARQLVQQIASQR